MQYIEDALFDIKAYESVIQAELAEAPEDLTLYQMAKHLNRVLAALRVTRGGEPYQVRPQMMYNYGRNGLIVKGRRTTDKVTKAQATEFITRFVKKNTYQ